MRAFMLAACAAAAGAVGQAPHPAWSAESPSRVAGAAPRTETVLSRGWRFSLATDAAGAQPPAGAGSWAAVSVPHTWNRVGYYIPDAPGRVNTPAAINKTQGVGWYRLDFIPADTASGRKAWLEFDAASRTAEVWLNGTRLGSHAGGFSRFRFDATAALKPGVSNSLVVRTDNTAPKAGVATADVLPLSGDFFVSGGLYRPVRLVTTDPLHFDMLDFGGPGIYASTTTIAAGRAEIAVRARVVNDGSAPTPVAVRTALLDARGAVAAQAMRRLTPRPGETAVVEAPLVVKAPRLWQAAADPYLYRLVVEIRRADGQLLDRSEQAFGIRQMRFDPERGFFLNGKPLRLHGVGLHQDVEGAGWAITRAQIEADIRTIREMGANTIRLTHYQHGPTVHDLADRYGLILWDEIPLVSVWTVAKGQTAASPGLVANAEQQLKELIRQNYNHPSVAVWGIANEVDFGNSLPNFLTGDRDTVPDPLPLLRHLNSVAKAEDASRPTTQATCCEGRLFAPGVEVPIVSSVTDVAGANRYFGWYFGSVADLGPHLDSLRASRPTQPLGVSEYGAGGAVTMHTDNPLGGPIDARGRVQPEEYQSYVHERAWATLRSKPYLWGTWLWNSFDFATTVRHEGDSDDINTKGLVTYDRMIRKDAFFFYKANWTNAPTVHITGRRYVDRAYPVTDIRVYSNARETRLSINGQAVRPLATCEQGVCVWRNVRLREGDNSVVASGTFAKGALADRVRWTLAAGGGRRFRIDSGAILAAPSKAGRFGSDNFFDGGEARTVNRPADYGRPPERKVIAGTADSDVMATYREGAFRYRVPVTPGTYRVKLTFVEPEAGVGRRVFDVLANGERKVESLDIASAAGGPLRAIERTFDVQVGGEELDLQFAPKVGSAVVSAVDVEGR